MPPSGQLSKLSWEAAAAAGALACRGTLGSAARRPAPPWRLPCRPARRSEGGGGALVPWRPTHTLVVRKLQHEVVRRQKVFLVHPTVVEVVVVHVLGRLAYLSNADTDYAAPPKGLHPGRGGLLGPRGFSSRSGPSPRPFCFNSPGLLFRFPRRRPDLLFPGGPQLREMGTAPRTPTTVRRLQGDRGLLHSSVLLVRVDPLHMLAGDLPSPLGLQPRRAPVLSRSEGFFVQGRPLRSVLVLPGVEVQVHFPGSLARWHALGLSAEEPEGRGVPLAAGTVLPGRPLRRSGPGCPEEGPGAEDLPRAPGRMSPPGSR